MREIGVPSSEMGARVDPPTYWWTDVYPVYVVGHPGSVGFLNYPFDVTG
jgi:hypothetical protein